MNLSPRQSLAVRHLGTDDVTFVAQGAIRSGKTAACSAAFAIHAIDRPGGPCAGRLGGGEPATGRGLAGAVRHHGDVPRSRLPRSCHVRWRASRLDQRRTVPYLDHRGVR